jgi:hypothetical protein
MVAIFTPGRDVEEQAGGFFGSFGSGMTPGRGMLGALSANADSIAMMGLGLASSPRNNPFENVLKGYATGSAMDARNSRDATDRQAMFIALKQSGVPDSVAMRLAANPTAAQLYLQQTNEQKRQKLIGDIGKDDGDVPTFGAPTKLPSAAGAIGGAAADPELEKKFIGGVRESGVTNPNALAAVAAYGNAESRYSPKNVAGTWSDPSESGQPGTSGGVLSWRGDRLKNMQDFVAKEGGDPVVAQAKFFAAEDPTFTQRLNAAKTPEEANRLMADQWRFAGYNRPGGEFARREGLTKSYMGKLGSAPAAGVQVASADPNFVPQTETAAPAEAPAAPSAASAVGQVAQAPAPAPTTAAQQPPAAVLQRQAYLREAKNLERKIMQYESAGVKGVADSYKIRLQHLYDLAKPTDEERKLMAAGGTPGSAEWNSAIRNSMPDTRPEAERRARVSITEPKVGEEMIRQSRATSAAPDDIETKARLEGVTGFLNDIAKETPKVAQRNADLDLLSRVVSRTSTGKGAELRATLDAIGYELNLSKGTLASQRDAIVAITNRIAPTLRQPGSGAQSDAELRGFLSSLPNLSALPEGNQLIQATLKRAAAIDQQRAEIAAQWQSKKLTAGEAREKIAELDRMSIYASEKEKAIVDQVMGFKPQTGPGDASGSGKGWRVLGVE